MSKKCEIVAHRGASWDAPENSLASVQLAVEHQAVWIELDIRTTCDGELVAFHDPTLNRTAGVEGSIEGMDWADLRLLDIGKWKAPQYAGERIPRLAEVLEVLPDEVGLFIELCLEKDAVGTVEKVLKDSSRPERHTVISFREQSIIASKQRWPDNRHLFLLRGATDDWQRELESALAFVEKHEMEGLDIHYSWAEKGLVKRSDFPANPFEVHFWTVNDWSTGHQLYEWGADGLTTDRAGLFLKELNAL